MRELVGGGGDLRFDDVEHGGGAYRSAGPESSSESQGFCRCDRCHRRQIVKPSHVKKNSSSSEYPMPKTFRKIFAIRRSKNDMPDSSSAVAVRFVEIGTTWVASFVGGRLTAEVVAELAEKEFLAMF